MMYDTGTSSPMSITATIDTQTNTPLPPPTVGEIIDMLFEARRTIAAQDKLIANLQESEKIWEEEHNKLDKERYNLKEEVKRLQDEIAALEASYVYEA